MNYGVIQRAAFAVTLAFSTTTMACGDGEKFGAVPLTFNGFNPAFNGMHYKLKPDPNHGWAIEDGDGARLFFNTAVSGSSQPCIQISQKDAPICGTVAINAWAIKAGVGKDKGNGLQIAIGDSSGKSVGVLTFHDSPGAYIRITPNDSIDYVQLTDTTQNLDNTHYNTQLKIEARKDLSVSDFTAKRDMSANGTELQNFSLVRCISVKRDYPDYAPIELTGHQVAVGTSTGEILKVTTPNGTVIKGFRQSLDALSGN